METTATGILPIIVAIGLFMFGGVFFWFGARLFLKGGDTTARTIAAMACAVGAVPLLAGAVAILTNSPRFIGIPLILAVLMVLSFSIWLIALVDCATEEPSTGNDKIVWILIILFLQVIGAVPYLALRQPQRLSAQHP